MFWIARGLRARLLALLIASIVFYAFGAAADVVYLAAVIALAYAAGLLILARPRWRVAVVALTVALLVAALGYFKYAAFVSSFWRERPVEDLVAPLGISFFTFEVIAYVVDLKRRVATPERSPLRLALFVAVFPHLVSGPIMRPNELLPQLRREIRWRLPTFISGLQLFVEGLAKKRLLADPAGRIVDSVFLAPSDVATSAAWLGAVAYTVQIYGDFAGYTDMGRGIARMIGLELPLNFDSPYAARSISDFWRRWHISLSNWLRDYVYIPLGGNRRGHARTYANLLLTMILGGLWHGAGLTFVLWGAYHGVLLAIERATAGRWRPPRWVGWAVTLFLVVNGWVIFRAQSFANLGAMFQALYVPQLGTSLPVRDTVFVLVSFVFVVGAMVVRVVSPAIQGRARSLAARGGLAYGVLAGVTLIVIISGASATRPFIYSRF